MHPATILLLGSFMVVFMHSLDVGCFSHTLDLVGDKIHASYFSHFMLAWLSLFSHRSNAGVLWKYQTSTLIHRYSPTRWWSKRECMKQVLELFVDVMLILQRNDNFSKITQSNLLAFFEDSQRTALLKVQLAVVVDFGASFTKTAFQLDINGPVAFHCCGEISALTVAVKVANYPNLRALARKLNSGNATVR